MVALNPSRTVSIIGTASVLKSSSCWVEGGNMDLKLKVFSDFLFCLERMSMVDLSWESSYWMARLFCLMGLILR